jgi:RND family efflux transporter MFP subunit
MEKLKQHKKLIIIAVIILVLAGAFIWGKFGYSGGQSKLPYAFVKVAQGDFIRQIKLTGTVKAAQEIQLSFSASGKASKVSVKAGDKVKAGQVIAELQKNDISANYLSAVAGWQAAQANLDAQKLKKQGLLNGAKSEDVAVSQTQVASAQKSLADAQTSLGNVQAQADTSLNTLYAKIDNSFSDAYNKSYDVVYHLTDGMFTDSMSASPKLAFATPLNGQAEYTAETGRLEAIAAVKKLDADRKSLAADHSNYPAVFSEIDADLSAINNYLDSLNSALNYTSPSNTFNQPAIDADKAVVSGAISSVNGEVSALDALKQSVDLQIKINQNSIFAAKAAVDQAQNALDLAQGQLTLKKSGSTSDELAIQDEQINQAQAQLTAAVANINKAKAQLDNATIVAPIDGVITSVNLDPGEAVNASVPVIGLQSVGKFQVETYLPELYIGEVKSGDSAKISFDAFGSDRIFDAKIISVDPAAQLVNNTLAYRTLLQFVNEEAEIKTGLTANIQIIVADDRDALSVPESSVIKDGEKSFVILASGEKREVTAGKTSGDGRIEILAGLTVKDSVADFGSLPRSK